MSDDLKDIYKGAGALDRFFEDATPVDLHRGKLSTSASELMQPTLIGWVTKTWAASSGSMFKGDIHNVRYHEANLGTRNLFVGV